MKRRDERSLIDEQSEYYDRRAPEYDETSLLEGDPLAPQGEQLSAALDAFKPEGRVLEMACVVRRRLRDGRTYRVVKVRWDLEARLRSLGWDIRFAARGLFTGRRAGGRLCRISSARAESWFSVRGDGVR